MLVLSQVILKWDLLNKMANNQYHALEEDFLAMLQSSRPDTKYQVAIFLEVSEEKNADLERKLSGLSSGPSEERSAIVNEYVQGNLKPLREYLDDNGITSYKLREGAGCATGQMTAEQILDIASKDYISSIIREDDPIFRVA